MAKEESKNIYETHNKRYDFAKKVLKTHQYHVNKAFTEAFEKHIMEDDAPNFDLLDYDERQEKVIKHVTDYLVNKVKTTHGLEAKTDFDKTALLREYMGTTPDEIRQIVSTYRSDLDYELLPQIIKNMNKKVSDSMYSVATEHIRQENVADITKKLGLEGKLSEPISVQEARNLLHVWKENDETFNTSMQRRYLGGKLKGKKEPKKPEAR